MRKSLVPAAVFFPVLILFVLLATCFLPPKFLIIAACSILISFIIGLRETHSISKTLIVCFLSTSTLILLERISLAFLPIKYGFMIYPTGLYLGLVLLMSLALSHLINKPIKQAA